MHQNSNVVAAMDPRGHVQMVLLACMSNSAALAVALAAAVAVALRPIEAALAVALAVLAWVLT